MKEIIRNDIANELQELYNKRRNTEYHRIRVTNLVYNPNKWAKSERDSKQKPMQDTHYINTYWHDSVLDVVSEYFFNKGLVPYKEGYINDGTVKGHYDGILYQVDGLQDGYFPIFSPYALLEIKNYEKTSINASKICEFRLQVLIYWYYLREMGIDLDTILLVIRNNKVISVYEYKVTKQDLYYVAAIIAYRKQNVTAYTPELDSQHNIEAANNL